MYYRQKIDAMNSVRRGEVQVRIIGRRMEIKELERCERSGKSELVCVYGRRRVGKTFLVEQTFQGSFAFRATGVESSNTRQQLKAFHQRLREHGDETRAIPKDWFEAFSRLDDILSREDTILSANRKKIVFFDEFPWFATPRSDFLVAFSEFWNRRGTESGDYLFIICGSATSWIIENVLENTGSLYHRVTCQIYLSPFSLKESEIFFEDRGFDWSRNQIMECQMVFGGLPFFMDLLNPNESFRQNVDRLIFRPRALLRGESNRLLEATLKKSPVYGQILELLAGQRYGMLKSQCKEVLGLSDGTFTRAVDDLVKCGYIAEYKRQHMRRNPLCIQLIDSFLLFHYRFLSDEHELSSYSELADKEGSFSNWRGYAFEMLCMHHLDQIKDALGISGVNTVSYPWVSQGKTKGAQIDLVIEREDKVTDLCEMKCTDRPFVMTKEDETKLLKRKNLFKEETGTKNALRIVLVSAEGLAGTAHTEHISEVITMDDLFR